jgi:hypothetical protein
LRALWLAAALLTLALAFTVARPHQVRGPVLRDFEAYWSAGVAWAAGDDPYSRRIWRAERTVPGVVSTREELLPFVGPPFGLPLWAFFARFDYGDATLAWRAVLGVAFIVLTLGSLELADGKIDWFERLAVLTLGVGFGPLTSGLALGQVAIAAAAGALATLFALRTRYALLAAAAALVAALQPNVGIALAARLGDRRAAVALALAGFVALAGSIGAAGGLAGFQRYIEFVRAHAGVERFIAIQTTPAAVARAFGAPEMVALALGILIALGVLGLLVAQFRSGRFDGVARFALASAALPLAWPFAHEHDFAIVLFPAIYALRRAGGHAWIAAAVGTLFVAVDWLGMAQRWNGVSQIALLALASMFAIALLGGVRDLPGRFAPAFAVTLVVIVGTLSRFHRLPIWPNALPDLFDVPRDATASAVWFLEQHASGIDRLDPWLGLLRALSLLGCALVWYSIAARNSNAAHDAAVISG